MGENPKVNITVIGGGPGGYAAAIMAARLNASVTLIEKGELGGTCLNEGCIPTKSLSKSAELFSSFKNAKKYGIEINDVHLDFKQVSAFKEGIVKRLSAGVAHLVKANQIQLIKGNAKIVDLHRVRITNNEGTTEINTDYIIIATGSKDITIPGFEPDGEKIVNSSQMLSIKELPKRLTIIGGGVIGVEFTSILSQFGVDVTVIELSQNLIPNVDSEITDLLRRKLIANGVKIFTECSAEAVNHKNEVEVSIKVKLKDGSYEDIVSDLLLVSVGRKANLEDLGIPEMGIETVKGAILTNERMQTNIGNVYAVGDVTTSAQLAHVAYHEARVAVLNICGKQAYINYKAVPNCIYTSPEIASVGLTEGQAREMLSNVRVAKIPFAGNGKAMIEGQTDGFMKMIVDGDTNKILGFSIIGTKATELIAEATLAINQNMKVDDLVETINAHPTLSEMVSEVSLASIGLNLHSV